MGAAGKHITISLLMASPIEFDVGVGIFCNLLLSRINFDTFDRKSLKNRNLDPKRLPIQNRFSIQLVVVLLLGFTPVHCLLRKAIWQIGIYIFF